MIHPTGETYIIATLDDFKKVPYHRLRVCLKVVCAEIERLVLIDRIFRAEHPGEVPPETVHIEFCDDGDDSAQPAKFIPTEEPC